MATYVIDYSDPAVPSFTVSPGETDLTTASIAFIGEGAVGYGEKLNENFLHILEHFASPTAPLNPVIGQFWFDKPNAVFYYWNGSAWVQLTSIFSSAVAPTSPVIGQLWYDTSVPQLKVYDGVSFVSVAARYLELAGGTLTGTLTLNADPTLALEAATKQYADALIVGAAFLSVPQTWTADQTFSDNLIITSKLKDYSVNFDNITSVAGVLTIDYEQGNSFVSTLHENVSSVVVQNAPSSGTYGEIVLKLVQGASAWTINWSAAYKFPDGTAHVMSTGVGEVDWITMRTHDGGATWFVDFSQAYS